MFNVLVIYKTVWDGGGSVVQTRSVSKTRTTCEPDSTATTQDEALNFPNFKFTLENGVFDKWRLFKVHYFVLVGSRWSEQTNRSTCLSSQVSVDRLHWLYTLGNHWDGPISVAVFVPDIEFAIARSLLRYFSVCFPGISDRINFNFIYPAEHPPLQGVHFDDLIKDVPCSDYKDAVELLILQRSPKMLKWRSSYSYPQNLLRNVGR